MPWPRWRISPGPGRSASRRSLRDSPPARGARRRAPSPVSRCSFKEAELFVQVRWQGLRLDAREFAAGDLGEDVDLLPSLAVHGGIDAAACLDIDARLGEELLELRIVDAAVIRDAGEAERRRRLLKDERAVGPEIGRDVDDLVLEFGAGVARSAAVGDETAKGRIGDDAVEIARQVT